MVDPNSPKGFELAFHTKVLHDLIERERAHELPQEDDEEGLHHCNNNTLTSLIKFLFTFSACMSLK